MGLRSKLQPHDLDKIKKWYFDENLSQYDISALLGISQKTISNFMSENGLSVRKHRPKSTLDMKVIRRMYEAGMCQALIAKELNISVTTVCRAMKRNNIGVRPSNRYPAKTRGETND